jgi:hypothetical protein
MKASELHWLFIALVFLFTISLFTQKLYADESNANSEVNAQKALTSQPPPKPTQNTDIQQGGILLHKGQVNLSVQETYEHYSSNNIFIQGFSILPVIVIGNISVQKTTQDIFITTLSAKYGILDNLEFELDVPYLYGIQQNSDSSASTPWQETKAGSGLGDISAALYYQPVIETAATPGIILGLSGKSRTGRSPFDVTYNQHNMPDQMITGSGFYSLKGSVTLVKTSDPVVMYGTLAYAYNFSRKDVNIPATSGSESTTANVNPGDTIYFNVGATYALNYKTSINVGYQQAYTRSTQRNGTTIVNSSLNSAVLQVGFNWAYNKNTMLTFNVGGGLTTDSPDMILNLILSYNF